METSEAVANPRLESGVDIGSLSRWTVDRAWEWSRVCGKFLRWQNEHLLFGEPSPDERQEHKTALAWLLRFTRLYLVAVADPEFPDRTLEKELRGRLRQLEDSWLEYCDEGATEKEAERELAAMFPDEHGA